jgi:hypothetical protein
MSEGGARGGECEAAAWHRPRGGQRVTPRRHTVLAEPGLGPAVTGPLRRARPGVGRRGRRGMPRRDVVRGSCDLQRQFDLTLLHSNFLQFSK